MCVRLWWQNRKVIQLRKEEAPSVPARPVPIPVSGELESVTVKKEKDISYHKQAWYEE